MVGADSVQDNVLVEEIYAGISTFIHTPLLSLTPIPNFILTRCLNLRSKMVGILISGYFYHYSSVFLFFFYKSSLDGSLKSRRLLISDGVRTIPSNYDTIHIFSQIPLSLQDVILVDGNNFQSVLQNPFKKFNLKNVLIFFLDTI